MQVSKDELISQELKLYHEASERGAKHDALLYLVRHYLIASDTDTKSEIFPIPPLVIERRHPAKSVAFLACFTSTVSSYIFLLKEGLNRVGRSHIWGEHNFSPQDEHLIEGRQWLLICCPRQTLVVDDHSTNGSIILRRGDPALLDPGFHARWFSLAKTGSNYIDLDWEGNTVCELEEGDVLVTIHAAFVYGHIPTE